MRNEKPLLKISISGSEVKPGRIAIPILLKTCQGAGGGQSPSRIH